MVKKPDFGQNALWKQRYRASKIAWARLASQNPERGLVCTDIDGILQLYAWDVVTGDLNQVTDQPAGVVQGYLSADGANVYYHQDTQGNEIGHLVRLPFAGGEAESITPDMPLYALRQFSQSATGNRIGFTTAGEGASQTYILDPGEQLRLIYECQRISRGPGLSAQGEIAVVGSSERSGTLDFSLLAFDATSGEQIAELWDGQDTSIGMGKFSPVPGDLRLLATSSQSGYERPLIWNPRAGERIDLDIDDIPGDVTPWDWSEDGTLVLLGQIHHAKHQLYVYDIAGGAAYRLDHPSGAFGGGYFAGSDEVWATWQDAAHPPRLVALDRETGQQKRTVLDAGNTPAGQRFESVTFASENEATIQGWLARPEGKGPFPTILHTHGGPTAVATESYSPAAQSWVDLGFAFFSINYHGSVTFGKDFEKSIWGNLGDLEVQDMASAYQWLVESRIADPKAVFLTGGSYGGYLTLQAIGRRPDLWAGGMAVVAVADWKLMYEDQAETLRGYQRALFGGTPEETREATASASPITYAEQIRAPLLVIQGSNDTRCPARQMRAYQERLNALGKEITVRWFDAGHGSRAQEQQIEHQEWMIEFVYGVLEGSLV